MSKRSNSTHGGRSTLMSGRASSDDAILHRICSVDQRSYSSHGGGSTLMGGWAYSEVVAIA